MNRRPPEAVLWLLLCLTGGISLAVRIANDLRRPKRP